MVSSSHFWNADGPGSLCVTAGFGSEDAASGSPADGAGEVEAGGAAGPEAGAAGWSVVDGAAGPDPDGTPRSAVDSPGPDADGSAPSAADDAPGPDSDGATPSEADGTSGPDAGGTARSGSDDSPWSDAGGVVGTAVVGAGVGDDGSAAAAACPNVSAQPIASVTAMPRRHFTTTHPSCQSGTRTEGRAEVEQSRLSGTQGRASAAAEAAPTFERYPRASENRRICGGTPSRVLEQSPRPAGAVTMGATTDGSESACDRYCRRD